MTFTIEIPLIGAMFLEVSGEWNPATANTFEIQGDPAEITSVTEMRIIVRGKIGTGPEREYQSEGMSLNSIIIMEPDDELNERLIDALEDRGGY